MIVDERRRRMAQILVGILEATYAGPDAKAMPAPVIGPDGQPIVPAPGAPPVPGSPVLAQTPAPPAPPAIATPIRKLRKPGVSAVCASAQWGKGSSEST
jgi:hypothetical protein